MITIAPKPLKVGKRVNTNHVEKVTRNYKQERWVHNSERLGKEDSLSAWWSIEELEAFIEEAKMHGADGLKFYFASYDEETAHRPEYIGLQTLVMVGTKQKVFADGSNRNRDIYVQTDKGADILAYNAARLCPPACQQQDTNTFDDFEIGISIFDKAEKETAVI